MNLNWTDRHTCQWADRGSRHIDGHWCGRFGWASLSPRARFIKWGWHIHKRSPDVAGQNTLFLRQREESQLLQWKAMCKRRALTK